MRIKANTLRPRLTEADVDVYLPRGVKALDAAGANPRGLFRIFQRHEGARLFGVEEYLGALASLMDCETIADTIAYAAPEGYALSRHETALTLEGPAKALMVNETLLHYLSTGTRFRTLAAEYPGDKFPWVFMGARYLAPDDLAIATRALSEEGILSTVPRWADRFIGTESHSQIAMWAGLRLDKETEEVIADVTSDARVAATIRATVAFARANPGIPLYVLGDFAARSTGCFETFAATRKACDQLGLPLVGGRMDVSRSDLEDNPIVDRAFEEWTNRENAKFPEHRMETPAPGMSPKLVAVTRKLLDEAGMADFKLVVSSGIKLETIKEYVEAGASIIGIGEEAAYFLNKGETNFTSDAVGYFEGERLVPFAKEGRELGRIADPLLIANATTGIQIAKHLVRINLGDYRER